MDNVKRRENQLLYISDDKVMEQQKVTRKLTQQLNTVDRSNFDEIAKIVAKLFGACNNAFVNPPFYCDYGFNIKAGKNLFVNYNCTILDVATVTFGDNCFVAPNVAIYTAGHPLHHEVRNSGLGYGLPVTIGNNVWLGGNTVVCPGVTIGDNTVIGAGSVVTKDIPANVVACGNPCKVVREITEQDKQFAYKHTPIDQEAKDFLQQLQSSPKQQP